MPHNSLENVAKRRIETLFVARAAGRRSARACRAGCRAASSPPFVTTSFIDIVHPDKIIVGGKGLG